MLAECAGYAEVLDRLRQEIITLLQSAPAGSLNERPLDNDSHETNSLAVLASHTAGAEYEWIVQVAGGRERTRHRPDEFVATADTAQTLIDKINRTAEASNAVLAALTEADLAAEKERGDRTFGVRWSILHAIEHTALHLGHMQLTQQLLAAQA